MDDYRSSAASISYVCHYLIINLLWIIKEKLHYLIVYFYWLL